VSGRRKTRDGAPHTLRLVVGDVVVYGSHGVGRVAVRERSAVLGDQNEIVVLEFAEGLTVRLPLERALAYLRPPSSEAELACVRETLRAAAAPTDDAWLRRMRASRDKVSSGDVLSLAEVVRDGARRDGSLTARGAVVRLSLAENQLYLKARRLLADEIQISRGIEEAEADAWITDQLVQTDRQGN
jgi:CarD family transcriptional regulator, regulator of rRNA transcription